MDVEAARTLALGIPGTIEGDHFGNPSYRAAAPGSPGKKARPGRIFMTLQIEQHTASLMLDVEEQADCCARHPEVFAPWPNKWGEKGATRVQLDQTTERVLKPVLEIAWRRALR